uniref:Aspartyl proteinase n=1 Tax=Ganoderma boninense TaxID=34458 RepID=A0A5K1JZQ9_9APHY|nr:Aspartyl proteinase [Ganoderma boninense]
MHRAALRVPLRRAIAPQRRSFVSTVLLTKAWENETVAELRKEAKKRGLTSYVVLSLHTCASNSRLRTIRSKGSKATLIARLQQDDQKKVFASEPASVAPQTRAASTVSSAPATESPTEIPVYSQVEPEAPVPIPFVPDLWESSKLRHESAPPAPEPSTGPKLVVVGGEALLSSGAPSYDVYSPTTASSSVPTLSQARPEPKTELGKLLAGMADDLGIPPTLTLTRADQQYDVAAKTETPSGQQNRYSRTLDGDEKTGLYVLLGIFAGSWFAGSALAPASEWVHKPEKATDGVESLDKAGEKH